MASMKALCPVTVGTVKDEGQAAKLHRYTMERNLHKMDKLLQKGVDVDSVNHLGQTPLFCAALQGLTSSVELLLQYGADPNHRSEDRSTPVHAAVFSCKPRLLSAVLDAGGDLRLHDHQGRTPQDWAKRGAQEHNQKMLDFLKSCTSHMYGMSQVHRPWDLHRTPSSSRTMQRARSLLEFFVHSGSKHRLSRKRCTSSSVLDTIQCYGFGKLYIDKPRQLQGLLACLPTIADSELTQVEDEMPFSYPCGSFTQMTNKSWRGCRVTVKELQSHVDNDNQGGYLDLLIIEQEFCSQLFHPHLLQLLAVSVSEDLQHTRLVFERVHIRPLHCLLHYRRDLLPVLGTEVLLLSMVLQVCEALLFLHSQGLVMRSLSSHAVQIVHTGVAKVTGLGFMVPSSEGDGPGNPAHLPLPKELYNWAAPEVIRQKACTWKADFYSLCALIQEIYTGAVPWGPADPLQIKQAVLSGQGLEADKNIPQLFYQLVRSGLQPQAQDRTSSLQELSYLIRRNMHCLSQDLCWNGTRESRLQSAARSQGAEGWSPGSAQIKEQEHMCCRPLAVREEEEEHECRLSDSVGEGENDDRMNCQEKLLRRKSKWKFWRSGGDPGTLVHGQEEALVDSTHSSLQVETSQDECPDMDLDSLQLSGSEISRAQDELEGAGEQSGPQQEPASKECEHLGSVVLNLKVSQALLQQSENSLQAVEVAGRDRGPVGRAAPSAAHQENPDLHCGMDKVDGTGADEADSALREKDRHGSSSISSTCSFTPAVGPPTAWYVPLSQGPLHVSSNVQRKCKKNTTFHTANWALRTTGSGHREEESCFESDYTQSPVEPCSMFFTPSLELQPHTTGRHSQTPSSEEDLEVTVEVCQPTGSSVEAAMEVECVGYRAYADEVDSGVADRGGEGSSVMSTGSSLTRAAGPPSCYYQPPLGVHTMARTREAEQLQETHDGSLHSTEDLSALQRECFPGMAKDVEYPPSDGEEQSLYTSAQEESFINPHPIQAEAGRDSVSSGVSERRGQQASTEQQSMSKRWGDESTSVLSAASQAEHHTSGLRERSDSPTKTKWTSETPTVHLQRASPRSVDGHVELLGHMQGPLDTFPWSSSTPQPLSADTFATTSTTDSASSILLSPVLSFEDVDTPTNLQEFPMGSSGHRQTTGPSRSQADVCHEGGMLAGYGITPEDRDSGMDIQAGGRKAETSTRTSRDTACPEEDSDPQQSDQRTSGDRACFEENSESVQSDQRASGERAHLEEDSESEQSDSGSGDSGCADSYCSTIIPDELPNAATHVACVHTGEEGLIPSDKQKREDDKDFPEEEEILRDEEVSEEEKVSATHFGLGPAELCINAPGEKGQDIGLSAEDHDLLEEGDRHQGREGKDSGDSKSSALEPVSQTNCPGVDSHQKQE